MSAKKHCHKCHMKRKMLIKHEVQGMKIIFQCPRCKDVRHVDANRNKMEFGNKQQQELGLKGMKAEQRSPGYQLLKKWRDKKRKGFYGERRIDEIEDVLRT